jgi:hypothetical protein
LLKKDGRLHPDNAREPPKGIGHFAARLQVPVLRRRRVAQK